MANRTELARAACDGTNPLEGIYRQAAYRWIILLGAAVFILWLGFFAGQVRSEGGVKRPWAVIVSRIMAAAGGVILVRLLLLSYEERVPVLLVGLHGTQADTELSDSTFEWIQGLRDEGTEIVPLADVVSFIAERRYVPKKCLALVIETSGAEVAGRIAARAAGANITVLLPPEAATMIGSEPAGSGLPSNVDVGVTFADPVDRGEEPRLEEALRAFAGQISRNLGREPVCARIRAAPEVDLRRVAKTTGYSCFLDGRGFNRFGDEPHLVRLLDVTQILRLRRMRGLNMAFSVGMFRGEYFWWPVAALARGFRGSSNWA